MRWHGRVGMRGFDKHSQFHRNFSELEEHLSKFYIDFYHLTVDFLNTRHFLYGQPDSQLPESVLCLIMHLLDEYMPMGILSLNQISSAKRVLRLIKCRGTYSNSNHSNQFYQMIPHSGNPKRLCLINDDQKYKSKELVVNNLRSVIESLDTGRKSSINPIEYFTQDWLRTQLYEIDTYSSEYQRIKCCVERTQYRNDYFLRLKRLFKVSSHANENFNSEIKNHHLLYHYTPQFNILGILREGLHVAPSHVYSANRFFGKHIYFWDCATIALSKFRNYPSNKAVLIICRVALGIEQIVPQSYFRDGEEVILEDGKNSLRCRGTLCRGSRSRSCQINEAKMFCGRVSDGWNTNYDLYNKYMVPNENQVKIEYIAEF